MVFESNAPVISSYWVSVYHILLDHVDVVFLKKNHIQDITNLEERTLADPKSAHVTTSTSLPGALSDQC